MLQAIVIVILIILVTHDLNLYEANHKQTPIVDTLPQFEQEEFMRKKAEELKDIEPGGK